MADFDPTLFGGSVPDPDVPEIPSGTLRPTTYGPGSPNPTPADLKEKIGNANNPLKAGDVALQPDTAKQYGLKTGDKFQYEGHTYNYADTPAARVGNVIDVYHPAEGGGFDPSMFGGSSNPSFDTPLSGQEEQQFQKWKAQYAPKDSGQDYDLRGAFKAGLTPDAQTGHWPDTFKKPNHPTFSDQSVYAQYGNPGHWQGDTFIPGTPTEQQPAPQQASGSPINAGFNPAQFDAPETPSATPTPPGNKNSLAASVGTAIAQGGAALRRSQGAVQPANYQYRTPIPPTSPQGNIVQPIPPPSIPKPGGYFYAKAGVMPGEAMNPEFKQFTHTPLINPDQSRAFIQKGAQIAGAGAPELLRFLESTRVGQGLVDTAAQTISGTTTPTAIAAMPTMMIPGVMEAVAADQLKQTPRAWQQLAGTVRQNGWLSREGAHAVSSELLRLGMIGTMVKGGAGLRASYDAMTPKVAPGDLWYQGVSAEGKTQWVTHDPKIAESYARRRGDDARVNVFTAEQVGEGAFEDAGGNPVSPREYAKHNWSTTIQGKLPEPIRSYQVGKPPPLPPSVFENHVGVSAIANKYQPETAGLAHGSSPSAAIARGSAFTPEQINQHISDLLNSTGDIQAQTAAVRVEGARLQARSEAAGKALQANKRSIELQKAADDAFKDWVDFQQGPQAILKGKWAQMGHELQGSVPVDLSSVNGLRQKFFNEVGREATISETKVLGKYARAVEETQKAYLDKLNEGLDQIAKRSKNVDASPEAMAKIRENIANRMGKKFPCRN